MKKNISLKAILIGSFVEYLGTVGSVFFITLAISIFWAKKGIPLVNAKEIINGTPYQLSMLLMVKFFTLLGAFTTGKLAKQDIFFHAGIFGLISSVISIYYFEGYPSVLIIFGIGLSLPVAFLGGLIVKKSSKKEGGLTNQ